MGGSETKRMCCNRDIQMLRVSIFQLPDPGRPVLPVQLVPVRPSKQWGEGGRQLRYKM